MWKKNPFGIRRLITNIIFPLVILILVVVTSGCIGPVRDKIPVLTVGQAYDKGYYTLPSTATIPVSPIGNLTRADIVDIPILVQAIDEVLASNTTYQWDYEITQQEWNQITHLFAQLDLPPQAEGDTSWYVSFEGNVLEIFLSYNIS